MKACCPAWVKYFETWHPDKLAHVSSAKSPIGMQGALIKTYYAHKMHLDPEKIVSVAVTPCTAKKFEISRDELCDSGKLLGLDHLRDNDYVVTTKELVQWCKEEGIESMPFILRMRDLYIVTPWIIRRSPRSIRSS